MYTDPCVGAKWASHVELKFWPDWQPIFDKRADDASCQRGRSADVAVEFWQASLYDSPDVASPTRRRIILFKFLCTFPFIHVFHSSVPTWYTVLPK